MRRRTVLLLTATMAALVAVLMISGLASAQSTGTTFTVDRSDDPNLTTTPTADDCTATANDCSLRGAMAQASANNNDPTVDVINFAIPGAGPHTISPTSELPDIDDPLTIDGYTEALGEATPATPNTLAFGTNAVLKIVLSGPATHTDQFNGFDGFDIEAGPTTIRGLVINGFKSSTNGSGGQAIGIFNVDGNTNNVIEGNFIGTNATGTLVQENKGDGVIINGPASTGNIIGGTTPAARNLIAGNGEQGVEISASDANTVQGNLIGLKISSTGVITDLGNTQDGVRMTSSSKNVVTDNVVAFNGDATHNDNGVEVLKSGTATPVGNRILSNSIFSNQALGIDLNDTTGTSPGDPEGREQDIKDPDTGPNNLQNYPVITTATTTGTTTTIKGTLNSRPRKTFTIQFFSNPTGEDEGKTYLGQVNVRTNKQGKASFNVLGPAVATGDTITATATNVATGDTSEFSDPVVVAASS